MEIIGIMSGTSLDGCDIAHVKFTNKNTITHILFTVNPNVITLAFNFEMTTNIMLSDRISIKECFSAVTVIKNIKNLINLKAYEV